MRYTGRACYHRPGLPQQGFQRWRPRDGGPARRPRDGGLTMVAYNGAHVVVTGGTGALGTAVVGALRAAGAVCHVTNIVPGELENFPHRNDPGVHVASGIDLVDEAAIRRFYAKLCRRSGPSIPSGGRVRDVAGGRNLGGRFRRSVPDERAVGVPVLGGCDPRDPRPQRHPAPPTPRGGASSTWRPGRGSNLGSAPAWSPCRRRRRRSPR